MIEHFLQQLDPPTKLSVPQLTTMTGKSEAFCREVRWGLYNPLPPTMAHLIDEELYDEYRNATRHAFSEAFDFPRFTTFADLEVYFDTTRLSVARAFCLQRSLMDRWDRSRAAHAEIFRAVAAVMGADQLLYAAEAQVEHALRAS